MKASIFLTLAAACALAAKGPASPFTDYKGEAPGRPHLIRLEDLPPPRPQEDVSNPPEPAPRPRGVAPRAPSGFSVNLFASGLDHPRQLRTAPNGDVFVAESAAGRIRVFQGLTKDGKPARSGLFALGLKGPFGLAFYPPGPHPQWLYVGENAAVVRFPYKGTELRALGPRELVMRLPSAPGEPPGGPHGTRDVAFSKDGRRLFVSVGSHSNVVDTDQVSYERRRADILAARPDGSGERVYASGLRNAVSLAVDPESGRLWADNEERDRLGDDLPPDFVTRVEPGGFYGWPWFYVGGHLDPRLGGKHLELRGRVLVPDVLLQPHSAPIGLTFYEGSQFPKDYRGDLFCALHGSWNRLERTGYEVARVPLSGGKPQGGYEDFLTGFVLPDGKVWGRPAGVTVASDGSLLVSDDVSGTIWRVSFTGGARSGRKSRREDSKSR